MTRAQKLLARHRRGEELTFDEMMCVCPHRVTLSVGRIDARPDGACVIIGNHPGAFSDRMRSEVVEMLSRGDVVMLMANRLDLLGLAMEQIGLVLMRSSYCRHAA
jgi:hypothetical protein